MNEAGSPVVLAAAAIDGSDAVGLAGLALLDSLSVGTLVIPVLMLLSPRVRAGSVLRYLSALAAFYFAIGLVLLAGTLELATMAPYLGAMGILAAAPGSFAAKGAILTGYVVVMCLPALALLAVHAVVGRRTEPSLRRLSDWLAAQVAATFPWILGLLGWFIGGSAASRLFG